MSPSSTVPLQIAIVGAGPAGLSAALLLQRQGHQVTVFERFSKPAPTGSGFILQPTGMAVLQALGCLDAALALGVPIYRMSGTDIRTGRRVLDIQYAHDRTGRFGLSIQRRALFDLLYGAVRAAGIAMQTGCTVNTLIAKGNRAKIASADAQQWGPFDLVVDAAGSRSPLNKFARRAPVHRQLSYGAWWSTLDWPEGAFPPNRLTQRYQRASVMIGVLPIGRSHVGARPGAAFFWSLKTKDDRDIRRAGLTRWKDDVRRCWPETESLLDQIHDVDQLVLAEYGHHTLRWPFGHALAVVGDSAHSTSPQLGQGANMALLDVFALSAALATTPSVDTALNTYAQHRRRHVILFQTLSYLLTPFYQSDSHLLPFVRDQIVPPLAGRYPLRPILEAMVSGTLVNPFRSMALSAVDWRSLDLPAPNQDPSPPAP